LEDGNIVRSLKVSLIYTGVAAALIIVLYYAAAMVSAKPRLARYHQRPSSEMAALARPSNQV
jgi:hypothetical protein